jgi:hypothetical protein
MGDVTFILILLYVRLINSAIFVDKLNSIDIPLKLVNGLACNRGDLWRIPFSTILS